ncbi:hypothetical protein LHP98_16425 [Rhodobacter sp. Har01]|uniref:hypothetical protein n=1 Tax=Rhodobacter sp. Har01 TaxID=2883999 RepID=UPI001D082C7C|nr:hypothetical protein [Rhodobacter sp. Har01]MCB6179708.1 hypothetical protein [Rhodobacter sp. Har01]
MRISAYLALGVVTAAVLAACAPKAPPPIMPEPVYDKYGNAIVTGQCRDGRQTYARDSAYNNLPICEDSCEPGYTTTAAYDQCVPIERGDDQPRNPQSPIAGQG